jgi:hypothetical protein
VVVAMVEEGGLRKLSRVRDCCVDVEWVVSGGREGSYRRKCECTPNLLRPATRHSLCAGTSSIIIVIGHKSPRRRVHGACAGANR